MNMFVELACLLPLVLWSFLRITLPTGTFAFDFDPRARGSFFALLHYYQRFFWITALVGIAGAVYSEGGGPPAGIFLLAALNAYLFNGLTVFFYESYLHALNGPEGKSNYSVGRYSLVLALGFSAVAQLFVGIVWTAVKILLASGK